MKNFKDFLEMDESVPFSQNMIGKLLTKDLDNLLTQLSKTTNDRKWTTLNNKAKKEFKSLNISGVDFHGYHDAFINYMKDKK